jgi:hypothetical protein
LRIKFADSGNSISRLGLNGDEARSLAGRRFGALTIANSSA